MPPPSHTRLSTILLLALAALATATTKGIREGEGEGEGEGAAATTALPRRQEADGGDEPSVGSACPDAEGQWNCMTTSFQRCGAGRWSEVQQCALGTRCSPAGRTYQFHVDFADGYLGAAPPSSPTSDGVRATGGGAGTLAGWALLGGLGATLAAVLV
ncbi:hypothetical protein F4802DRAFT_601459 [Xylaria palmicola]|nr:hypothetical protein F4802DRAFT_601459 [Xylaria palmicola]